MKTLSFTDNNAVDANIVLCAAIDLFVRQPDTLAKIYDLFLRDGARFPFSNVFSVLFTDCTEKDNIAFGAHPHLASLRVRNTEELEIAFRAFNAD